jgi:hypothetical protein
MPSHRLIRRFAQPQPSFLSHHSRRKIDTKRAKLPSGYCSGRIIFHRYLGAAIATHYAVALIEESSIKQVI